jgi:hypothetical protein
MADEKIRKTLEDGYDDEVEGGNLRNLNIHRRYLSITERMNVMREIEDRAFGSGRSMRDVYESHRWTLSDESRRLVEEWIEDCERSKTDRGGR